MLHPDGTGSMVIMGQDILTGHSPQIIVPKGVWQGARLVPGGKYALMGTTVAPGFEFSDYEHGRREDLIEKFPSFRKMIESLSR